MSHQQTRRSASMTLLGVLSLPFLVAQAFGQEHPPMPAGMSHEEHMKQMSHDAEMKKRGDAAMGFDQDKVSHHFHLTKTGGSIEVGVKQSGDVDSRQQIREHLKTISQEFAQGVFTSPTATHSEVPPGVPVMQERKSQLRYAYQETAEGARVTISTTDRTSLAAVHSFLKYQIREHATGDPLSVQ